MSHPANMAAAMRVKNSSHNCTLAAITRYDDELQELKDAGVDLVFNVYAEAGTGFSDHVCSIYDKRMGDIATSTDTGTRQGSAL